MHIKASRHQSVMHPVRRRALNVKTPQHWIHCGVFTGCLLVVTRDRPPCWKTDNRQNDNGQKDYNINSSQGKDVLFVVTPPTWRHVP